MKQSLEICASRNSVSFELYASRNSISLDKMVYYYLSHFLNIILKSDSFLYWIYVKNFSLIAFFDCVLLIL